MVDFIEVSDDVIVCSKWIARARECAMLQALFDSLFVSDAPVSL
jgi:hypothetical protein